jgi:hypothetical protein
VDGLGGRSVQVAIMSENGQTTGGGKSTLLA